MKKTIVIITMFVVQLPQLFAGNTTDTLATQKEYFNQAKAELVQMLSGAKPLDYERAVFVTENAYLGNTISYELFQGIISFHANNITRLAEANRKPQVFKPTLLESEAQQRDNYEKLLYNWAIYTYFTDTTAIMYNNEGKNSIYLHLPFDYPTNDPMATLDWSNSQTINLLDDKAANCNAQVALYKILSDRLKTDAKIGTAPSHAYITHTDTRGTTYNVELPTRSFPGAGAIMTVTYTPISAVSSGISMRSLTPSQSVALCLVYLAKGYEHKFGKADNSFTMNCSETALRYDSLCLNAMLLKAEIFEEKVIAKHKTATQLQTDKDFIAYQKIVGTLYKKGYREMPIDMKNLIVSHLKQDSANFFLQNRTPQGFQTIKPNDDRYATLSWGKFDEVHEPKRFEQYGRAIFDTKTMKISKLVTADSLYNNYPFDPVIAAWQVDPLAHEFPSMSPYVALGDNPILYIDPDGQKIVDANGNSVTLVQDSKGNYTGEFKFAKGTSKEVIEKFNNNGGRLVKAMLEIKTGREIIREMDKSKDRISINISKADKLKIIEKDGKKYYKGDLGDAHATQEKTIDGKHDSFDFEINIYEGSINTLTENTKNPEYEDNCLTQEQKIAVTGVHEGTHVTKGIGFWFKKLTRRQSEDISNEKQKQAATEFGAKN